MVEVLGISVLVAGIIALVIMDQRPNVKLRHQLAALIVAAGGGIVAANDHASHGAHLSNPPPPSEIVKSNKVEDDK
jgi:hypothetical protein